jgi:chaperonin GroEL (HSP60 family)
LPASQNAQEPIESAAGIIDSAKVTRSALQNA